MARVTQAGDVFVRRHSDGRYAAVRVLRVDGRSVLLTTTTYLGMAPPLASHAELRLPVVQHRFFYEGQAATRWVTGKPPSCFVFAFNLVPDETEVNLECHVYGGTWADDAGSESLLEWRWTHDRDALEAEVRADQLLRDEERKRAALAQRPKRMMPAGDFWALIGLLDWSKTGDDAAVLAPLVGALTKLTKPSLKHFAERLAYCLYALDTRAHAQCIGSESYVDEESHFSSDLFLYTRCAVVANGKGVYEAALANPQCMPKDLEFEALLGAARSAWEAKMDSDFDYETGCRYESFSNLAGWAKEVAAQVSKGESR